jgi:hypothetical protein
MVRPFRFRLDLSVSASVQTIRADVAFAALRDCLRLRSGLVGQKCGPFRTKSRSAVDQCGWKLSYFGNLPRPARDLLPNLRQPICFGRSMCRRTRGWLWVDFKSKLGGRGRLCRGTCWRGTYRWRDGVPRKYRVDRSRARGRIPSQRMSIHESRASRNRGGLGMMPLGVSFRSIRQTKETGDEDFGNRFGKDQERHLCV